MSILQPIQGAEGELLLEGTALFIEGETGSAMAQAFERAAALFIEAETFTANAHGTTSQSALFIEGETFSAHGALLANASALFIEAETFTARGHKDGVADLHGAALFIEAEAFGVTPAVRRQASAYFYETEGFIAQGFLTQPESFGFTIYLDILDSAIGNAGNIQRLSARLLADGAEIPIQSYSLSGPEGALGVQLSVTLARVSDRALLGSASSIDLEVGIWNGTDYIWIKRLESGRLAGSTLDLGFNDSRPTDTFQFSTIDLLADRWTLRPDQPVTLYDPQKMDAPQSPSSNQTVRNNLTGLQIVTFSEAVTGLTAHEVFRRAYVAGCGFDDVVTNIPDFPVAQAEFTLSGGYHNGAKALLELFEPVYFVDGNSLWIADASAPLPAGMSARPLPLSAVTAVSDATQARAIVSGLIVEYRATGGDFFTERTDIDPPVDSGTFGVPGYTRQETTRRIREGRNLSAPGLIVSEEQVEVITTTYNHLLEITSRETQSDRFDSLNRKSGHAITIEGLLPTIEAGAFELQTFSEEKYSIFYRQTGISQLDEISQTVKALSGLVLVDEDKPYLGNPYELPYLEAHHSGYIDPDGNQHTEFKSIKTEIETYVRQGASVEVRRQVSNHLNGPSTPEPSSSATRAGSIAVSRRSQGIVKQLLSVEGAPTGRIVPTYNAGDLPPDLALLLGGRKLVRLNSGPRDLSVNVYGLAPDLRRGTQVEAYDRAGVLGNYIITAFQEQGRRQGNGFEIVQSFSGKELK